MKMKYILSITLLMIFNVFAQENIINELGKDGKFIVRDIEKNDMMVIKNGEIEFKGEIKFEALPVGRSNYSYVIWDKSDKQLKTISNIETTSMIDEKPWHAISFDILEDSVNVISANTMSTNSVTWNEFYTDYGYIKIGPANNWAAHIFTDRGRFIFNKELMVRSGRIGSQWNHLFLRTDGKTRIFVSKDNGDVGIGTEAPGAKLEVAGRVKITGGSPGSGKVLTSDGTGLASWQTPSSGGGSSLWFESADNVYRSSGNVGIGLSDPAEKLEVAGSALFGTSNASSFVHIGDNYFSDAAGSLNPGLYLYKNGSIAYGLKLQSTNSEYGTMMFGPNISNTHLSFGKTGNALQDDNMVEYMRIDLDNGNVGIGTKTPGVKLEVEGTACVTRYGTKSVQAVTNGTWDLTKGNIAEVNFGSSITSITITSDECVGTYVLIVKKSGSCSSCSLDIQGANIMWAYGVPPTLSSGSNTTDIISLIAVGNNTFYGYTANNFF